MCWDLFCYELFKAQAPAHVESQERTKILIQLPHTQFLFGPGSRAIIQCIVLFYHFALEIVYSIGCSLLLKKNYYFVKVLREVKQKNIGLIKKAWAIELIKSVSSVAESCLTLCDPMNSSMPCLPVHHQHLEFTQTHVH